jgi:hypothetical protein
VKLNREKSACPAFSFLSGMKRKNIPDTAAEGSGASIPGEESGRAEGGARRIVVRVSAAALLAWALVVLYLLANKSVSNRKNDPYPVPEPAGRHLDVEVLDGVGNMKIAQRATDYLRAQGYDVVEMKKNLDGIADRSFVLDRSGDFDAARRVAAALGIPPNKVFQKIDRNLYLDVTVTIGKDFSKLKAFQSYRQRSAH